MKTTATIDQLRETLKITNEKHGYKLEFNRLEQSTRNRVLFTLKSPSKIKGARISHSGRNLPKASWHAHGNFFDELFIINPQAVVFSLDKKITVNEGNWSDYNIGSHFKPMMASETSIGE
jgi:hypothetical protein